MNIQLDKAYWKLVSQGHLDQDLFTLSYDLRQGRQETAVTYLGEVIDARLNMTLYITRNIRNAQMGIGLMRYTES